jgi:ribosomal protein L19E
MTSLNVTRFATKDGDIVWLSDDGKHRIKSTSTKLDINQLVEDNGIFMFRTTKYGNVRVLENDIKINNLNKCSLFSNSCIIKKSTTNISSLNVTRFATKDGDIVWLSDDGKDRIESTSTKLDINQLVEDNGIFMFRTTKYGYIRVVENDIKIKSDEIINNLKHKLDNVANDANDAKKPKIF